MNNSSSQITSTFLQTSVIVCELKWKQKKKNWDNDRFHLAVYKCYFPGNLFWCKIYFVVLTMHASLIMGLFSGQTLLTVIFHLKFPRAEMLLLQRACGEMNADFEWHIANCCVIINRLLKVVVFIALYK